jgi:isocitrate/methylisocitrate lyase
MKEAEELESVWRLEERWNGIARPYRPEDVARLRGSLSVAHTLASEGARRLWNLLHSETYLPALGAMTGTQAVQMVQAGLPVIYASGWQVAADANNAAQTYPDQSLYPADSMPNLVRRINNALRREDEKQHAAGSGDVYWFAPIIADAEAGFGGTLNVFELTKALIEAGTAGLHLEDQLASAKKCGHMGGKVLVPTREFNQKLWAARLAADIMDVPTILIARTDALSAKLLTSDVDPRDAEFLTGPRTPEGFFEIRAGLDIAIARGLSYAPYADLLWFETAGPDLEEAQSFASAVHAKFPGKLLAYNCSPSFNWRKKLSPDAIAHFQTKLGELGYAFQFVTLAGFHALNHSMFKLARAYAETGMLAYSNLQQEEFAAETAGYQAVKHQSFVGAGYFDDVAQVLSGGLTTTLAMDGSTETEQFRPGPPRAGDEPTRRPARGSAIP